MCASVRLVHHSVYPFHFIRSLILCSATMAFVSVLGIHCHASLLRRMSCYTLLLTPYYFCKMSHTNA